MTDYNFTKKGNGSPLVLVHGWGGSIKSLEQLGQQLCKDFQVFNLELPGHGSSREMDSAWQVRDFSDFVSSFIKNQNLESVVYVGHSFGGKIGIELSVREPELISKLVLINTSGLKPRNSLKKKIWKSISSIAKPLAIKPVRNIFYKYVLRERDYIALTGNLKETFRLVIEEHFDDLVQNISKPTLLMWGAKDKYTPLWMGEDLSDKLKNSKLVVFNDDKHNLPLVKPKEVAVEITDWIKNY